MGGEDVVGRLDMAAKDSRGYASAVVALMQVPVLEGMLAAGDRLQQRHGVAAFGQDFELRPQRGQVAVVAGLRVRRLAFETVVPGAEEVDQNGLDGALRPHAREVVRRTDEMRPLVLGDCRVERFRGTDVIASCC